jgi:hypothetical protein
MTTGNLLRRVRDRENNLWGTTTFRARVAGRLDRFVHRTTAPGLIPDLTEVMRELHAAVVALRPAETGMLPSYPAFARPGEPVAAPPEWWFEGA